MNKMERQLIRKEKAISESLNRKSIESKTKIIQLTEKGTLFWFIGNACYGITLGNHYHLLIGYCSLL